MSADVLRTPVRSRVLNPRTTLVIILVLHCCSFLIIFFFFQAEDGIRDYKVTGVQTCALPILAQGLWLGFLSWLGFAATVGLTANMFSEKPIAAWVLDTGYQLSYLVLMGVQIGRASCRERV